MNDFTGGKNHNRAPSHEVSAPGLACGMEAGEILDPGEAHMAAHIEEGGIEWLKTMPPPPGFVRRQPKQFHRIGIDPRARQIDELMVKPNVAIAPKRAINAGKGKNHEDNQTIKPRF